MSEDTDFDAFAPDLQRLEWVDIATVAQAVGGTCYGASGGEVRGAVIDNRRVRGGELFICMPGAHVHGAKFAADAVRRGAAAVLTDAVGYGMISGVEVRAIVVPDVASVAGKAADLAWGQPAKQLQVWGVTGTNGKTTTTYLLRHLLHRLGHRSALVGTVEVAVGKQSQAANITTPQAPEVQAVAAVAVQNQVKNLVLEVSSHALGLGRVDPLHFGVAGFTNLSHDHLDFHHSMEDYFQTKASLFSSQRSAVQVILVDDQWGQRLAGQLERAGQHNYVTLSTTGVQADWQASITPLADGSSQLELRAFDGKSATVQVLMPGAFNAANAALAMVMVVSGCSPSPRQLDGAVLRRLAAHPIHVDVPGRMEVISEGGTMQPRVIVDFAHNPGALRSLLDALRPSTPGRLLLVFGATGQRDTEKRPILGEICAKFADYFYLTDDDPHDEDPQAIRQAVRAGIPQGQDNFEEIDGRETAIRRAIAAAQPGDTVVIAGRGHETVQETASAAINLDDRAVAREALALR